ncbi:GHMP family kinase ATP-binding protein [Streptomyces sp. NPDC001118]
MNELDAMGARTAVGVGRAFGTFGELLQGVLPGDDQDFLVTFPIARWTTAVFSSVPGSKKVTVHPAYKQKSRVLAELMLGDMRAGCGGDLTIDGELPVGKGFASSSADLVATARAVAGALGEKLAALTIENYMRRIEPSDGVMYPGIVAFYHRAVRLREQLGVLPKLTIVAHDEGGEVDTVRFNRIPKPFDDEDKLEYGKLLALLAEAVRDGDLSAVGAVATRSAVMNSKIRPHSSLGDMQCICREIDGLGLVAAHSGTMLGILLAADDPEHSVKVELARKLLSELPGTVEVYESLAAEDFEWNAHSYTSEGQINAV